jgi:iron complex outermembrane receptor protein
VVEARGLHGVWGPFVRGGVGARGQSVDFRSDNGRALVLADEHTAAVYGLEETKLGPLELQLGARFDYQRSVPRSRDDVQGVPVRTREFGNVSGALTALYEAADGLRLGIGASRAFKTPSPEQLFSQGPHLASYSYEVGNPELRAETGLGLDAFVRIHRPRLRAELAGFWSSISSYIYPENTGALRGNLYIYRFTNTGARFLGWEAAAGWSLRPGLTVDAGASYVHATNSDLEEPLSFIPPLSGHLKVRLEGTRSFVEIGGRGSARQSRVGTPPELPPFSPPYCESPDDTDCRPVPGEFLPTDGYAVLDAAVGYRWIDGARVQSLTLRIGNVMDRQYRNHLSRIKELAPETGRTLSLLYRLSF